jgi:hypothetical protein
MAPKFLCCLPARFGVFIISLLQFLVCGGLAGFLWWALWYDSENDAAALAKTMKVTVIVVASVYTFVALISLIGFIGAILRKYKFIKTFFIVLFVSLLFQVAVGIWYLVTFYKTRNQSLDDCLDGSTNQTKLEYCKAIQVYKKYPQGYILANVIVPIVIQLYACVVVHSYSRYLEHEDAEKHRHFNRVPGPVYQPVNHRDEQHYPLTDGTYTYPFKDGSNSYGGKV